LGTGLEQYEKAIQCTPGFLNAYFNRANTCYELKTYYRALEDLNRVIQVKTRHGHRLLYARTGLYQAA